MRNAAWSTQSRRSVRNGANNRPASTGESFNFLQHIPTAKCLVTVPFTFCCEVTLTRYRYLYSRGKSLYEFGRQDEFKRARTRAKRSVRTGGSRGNGHFRREALTDGHNVSLPSNSTGNATDFDSTKPNLASQRSEPTCSTRWSYTAVLISRACMRVYAFAFKFQRKPRKYFLAAIANVIEL